MVIYKFVSSDRKSIAVYNFNGAVQYKQGEFVSAYPQYVEAGYHLLAFNNQKNAINTAIYYGWTGYLWLAIGKEEVTPIPSMLSRYELDKVDRGKPFIPICKRDWPEGTVMYERIKLISIEHEFIAGGMQ